MIGGRGEYLCSHLVTEEAETEGGKGLSQGTQIVCGRIEITSKAVRLQNPSPTSSSVYNTFHCFCTSCSDLCRKRLKCWKRSIVSNREYSPMVKIQRLLKDVKWKVSLPHLFPSPPVPVPHGSLVISVCPARGGSLFESPLRPYFVHSAESKLGHSWMRLGLSLPSSFQGCLLARCQLPGGGGFGGARGGWSWGSCSKESLVLSAQF